MNINFFKVNEQQNGGEESAYLFEIKKFFK